MITFNIAPFVGTEFKYMKKAIESHKICGDGPFTKKCDEWMEHRFVTNKVLLTTSGSSALDMAAFLCGIEPGMKLFYHHLHFHLQQILLC